MSFVLINGGHNGHNRFQVFILESEPDSEEVIEAAFIEGIVCSGGDVQIIGP